MTGRKQDFRLVEAYVNALESSHVPAQTLGFHNLAVGGDWQLLFSTNLMGAGGGGGEGGALRLRELRQIVTPNSYEAGAAAMGGEP